MSRLTPPGSGRWRLALAVVLTGLLVAAGCGGDDGDSGGDTASDTTAADGGSGDVAELRLGYFPNVTHAPAVAAVQEGFFDDALDGTATVDLLDLRLRHRGR